MKRAASLLLALALLSSGALAAQDEALGLYTPLDEGQQAALEQAAASAAAEVLLPTGKRRWRCTTGSCSAAGTI